MPYDLSPGSGDPGIIAGVFSLASGFGVGHSLAQGDLGTAFTLAAVNLGITTLSHKIHHDNASNDMDPFKRLMYWHGACAVFGLLAGQ